MASCENRHRHLCMTHLYMTLLCTEVPNQVWNSRRSMPDFLCCLKYSNKWHHYPLCRCGLLTVDHGARENETADVSVLVNTDIRKRELQNSSHRQFQTFFEGYRRSGMNSCHQRRNHGSELQEHADKSRHPARTLLTTRLARRINVLNMYFIMAF